MMETNTFIATLEEIAEMFPDNTIAQHMIDTFIDEYENLDEVATYLKDVVGYGAVSGVVTELTYYHQTYKFFDEHYETINDLYNDYVMNVGNLEITDIKNDLTWLAYEMTAQLLLDQIEYYESVIGLAVFLKITE